MNSHFTKSIAVVIGIDAYTNGIPALQSAVNDAKKLSEKLSSEHEYEVKALFDTDATFDNLINLLEHWLPNHVSDQDRVLFYFAGHGVALDSEDGPQGYLLPQDATRSEMANFLEMTRLHDSLLALPCRHMLIILDSCFSGSFRWSTSRDVIMSTGVVHHEAYERFLTEPAWQLLTSAAHDQTAADQLFSGTFGVRGGDDSHSPFALALFEALDGAADLVPEGGDGIITATELYLYLESALQQAQVGLSARQTPGLWPLKRHNKGEFIFKVKDKDINLPPAPVLNADNNPYLGLQSYESSHAGVYFGRGNAIENLLKVVEKQKLTVVLGASGSGKSSLVKAGLAPRLEENGFQIVSVLRPGPHPLTALQKSLEASNANVDKDNIIVIDQFEEMVTMTRDETERECCFNLIANELEDPSSKFSFVLTLRADFEAHFQLDQFASFWHKGRFTVPPLSRSDLKDIIECPASERVLYFEPSSLVEQLIDDVIAMPGALPLLSFTLSEMYLHYLRANRGDRALTQQDYDHLGGVSGALKTRADKVLVELGEKHRDSLKRLMLRMVKNEHGAPVRQRITEQQWLHWDNTESHSINVVIDKMCDARLLVRGITDTDEKYVEPAHDALITSWTRLMTWISEAQSEKHDLSFLQTLRGDALEWSEANAQTRPGLLWRDKVRSDRLWSLRKHNRLLLSKLEDEFCRLSVRRQRIIKSATIASIITIVVSAIAAVGFGLVADNQRQLALEQRDQAQQQTMIANSNALAASAANAIDVQNNTTAGLKLAKLALDVNPENEVARWLVRRAIYRDGVNYLGGMPFSGPLYTTLTAGGYEAVWSEDGKYIAAALYSKGSDSENDKESTLIFSAKGELISTLSDTTLVSGQFTKDNQFYIDGNGVVWSLDGMRVEEGLSPSFEEPKSVGQTLVYEGFNTQWYHAYSQNGQIVAGHGALLGFLDLDNDLPEFQIVRDNQVLNTLNEAWPMAALSPDGNLLVTGNYDGDLVLWQMNGTGQEADRLYTLWQSRESANASHLQFSPDGRRISAIMRDGVLRVWDLQWNPLYVSEAAINEMVENMSAQEVVKKETRLHATLDDSYAGADTPFFIINASDTKTGNNWNAEIITSEAQMVTMEDFLAVQYSGGTDLYDHLGNNRLYLHFNLNNEQRHPVDAIPGHLVFYSWRIKDYVVVPFSSEAILSRANRLNQLKPTQSETLEWGVSNLDLSETSNTVEQQSLSFTQSLSHWLTDLIWREDAKKETLVTTSDNENATVSIAIPAFDAASNEMPFLWEKIAQANKEEGNSFYLESEPSSIRWYLTNVRESNIPFILNTLGAPEPFLSGPHTLTNWEVYGSDLTQFGHYNPLFLSWLESNVLPTNKEDPLRVLTQPIYNKAIKHMMRIHAYGLQLLETNPELNQRLLGEYMTIESNHQYWLYNMTKDAAFELIPELATTSKNISYAAGFWIRRELDGTKPQFQQLMMKTLAMYDDEFLQTLQNAE